MRQRSASCIHSMYAVYATRSDTGALAQGCAGFGASDC